MRISVEVEGRAVHVDGEDVLLWRGLEPRDRGEAVALAQAHAAGYVAANPRPGPDAQGARNRPARQRLAALRRLAVGPATRRELLAAMRTSAGYVGADDFRNRMDELQARGQRGSGHLPITIGRSEGHFHLDETFPLLDDEDREAVAELKGWLGEVETAARHRTLLDRMFPDVPPAPPPLPSFPGVRPPDGQ